MFIQQMASDIFVRILRGMGACRKKPAQPASGALSWMTPSETLLRLCLGGFGDMKWAWGGGWRLPAFLCQTTSSPGFCPISRAHFRDRKTLRKRVHHKGPPLFLHSTAAPVAAAAAAMQLQISHAIFASLFCHFLPAVTSAS